MVFYDSKIILYFFFKQKSPGRPLRIRGLARHVWRDATKTVFGTEDKFWKSMIVCEPEAASEEEIDYLIFLDASLIYPNNF